LQRRDEGLETFKQFDSIQKHEIHKLINSSYCDRRYTLIN